MGYIEPAPIPDIYISGIASVDEVGEGTIRFSFYVRQTDPTDGSQQRVIVARLICAEVDFWRIREKSEQLVRSVTQLITSQH